jgi:hypothetical protein
VQDQGYGRPAEAVILRARSTWTTVAFGFLTVLWILALVVSEGAQTSSGGSLTAAVFFGLFIAGTVAGWVFVDRGRRQLEVGRDAIVTRPGRQGKPFTLTRDDGDTLRILPKFRAYGSVRAPRLLFLGTGGFIALGGFSLDQVSRACQAQGWRFDGDPALAIRDVRGWLHKGRTVEAAQLIEVFGPFPGAAADDEPHLGLEAAVFEDLGDKLGRGARDSARTAYRRAAEAQRAFAAHTPVPEEAAARLAEAERIEGKARG